MSYVKSLLLLLLLASVGRGDDVQGCGGYVKSDVEINFSQVGIKLFTAQGSLKYETECAPNDGYYFIPVFDKGQYIIKVAPPSGWSVEPAEVAVNFDGKTDSCSLKEDINFHFKGFAVIGQVQSAGPDKAGGPKGILVSLHRQNRLVLTTETSANGRFVFTPLAGGDYIVTLAHKSWQFITESASVSIADENGHVSSGSLVVQGYSVEGAVTGPVISGVSVVLHSDHAPVKQHYKKYPPGCTAGAPKGYTASPGVGDIICHVTTDSKGRYSFTNTVPGQYNVVAHKYSTVTQYVMSPQAVAVTVPHDDVTVKESFKVEGFSVRGRVLGTGVAGAVVSLQNTPHSATTGKDGSYSLPNVRQGAYTVTATAAGVQFPSVKVQLSAVQPTVADLSPSHYSACFHVQLDQPKPTKWTVSIASAKGVTEQVTTDDSGRGCGMLVPGQYTAAVLLTTAQQQQGIRFGPAQHSLTVGGESTPSELVFSQFLGEVAVKVACLEQCPATLDVTLTSSNGVVRTASAAIATSGAKQVTTTFTEVVPGHYQVSVVKSDWCWKQDSVPAEINTKNVQASLAQSGYLLMVASSHATELQYDIEGDGSKAKKSVAVQQGTTKKCLTAPGSYVFTPHSCHQFSEKSYSWKTSQPTLLSLTATHHTVSATIRGSQAGAFKLKIEHQDGSSSVVDPKSKDSAGNEYVFEFLAKEHEQILLTPSSSDNLFQYEPLSHSEMIGSDCMSSVVTFKAVKALFIHGKVTPVVAGVEIVVQVTGIDSEEEGNSNNRHVFETGKDGKFTAGPLDNSQEYVISAAKLGYTLKPIDGKKGHFEAFKLAEVLVDIKDSEDNTALHGVVVSMSGGKSYRQNSLTLEDGSVSFHSLLPGEYFLRFAMKEYNFEPPTMMVTVEQGATINIKVKGVRVAYSAMGSVTSLTGVVEGGVEVEAVGRGTECAQYQEEATTDDAGAFRIRGLLPKCEYNVGLKSGEGINRHIERMLPATTTVKVTNKDVTGLDLMVLRHFNQMDVVGFVDSPKEHLGTLSIKVYRDDVSDSPIHTIKVTSHPFFMLPPLMADGKTYTLQLQSTLSTLLYSYRMPEVSFVADSSFKQMKLNFRPTHRNLDSEMNHSTMSGLMLAMAIIGMVANFEKIAPAIDWSLDVVSNFIASRSGKAGARRNS